MNRINKLLLSMESLDLDGMLIISESNINYLTGFTGDSSRLLVSKNGCVFLTDGRYTEQATHEIHQEIEIFNWINDNRYGVETYQKFINEFAIKRLGFESSVMSHSIFQKFIHGVKNIDMIPTDGLINMLRMIKDDQEIEMLRQACRISDRALELTMPYIDEGITEKEIAARLEFHLKMEGANGISFETIIVSGQKTSLLHGQPTNKKLSSGDFLQIDFGALYCDYHADMSRTFVIGKASEKQQELYGYIKSAEMEAIKSLKSGLPGNVPDTIVRNIIPDSYLNYYYSGLGHGVGLEIHEEPFIKNTSTFTFQAGMVVTIEPGVYIPGWGGMRIEDTVLVTANGYEMLTHFPRDMMEL